MINSLGSGKMVLSAAIINPMSHGPDVFNASEYQSIKPLNIRGEYRKTARRASRHSNCSA